MILEVVRDALQEQMVGDRSPSSEDDSDKAPLPAKTKKGTLAKAFWGEMTRFPHPHNARGKRVNCRGMRDQAPTH